MTAQARPSALVLIEHDHLPAVVKCICCPGGSSAHCNPAHIDQTVSLESVAVPEAVEPAEAAELSLEVT